MRVTEFVRFFALAALATASLSCGRASAAIIFSDDFESGSMANWTQTTATAGTSLVISNAQNIVPAGGSNSASMDNSADRMHRNIIADNAGSEVTGYSRFVSWIYDDGQTGSGGANRVWNEVRGYSGGTGLPNGGIAASGALSQLFAIGKHNSVTAPGEVHTNTKYQARSLSGSLVGFFNLNGPGSPNRSIGWHKFTVERLADNTTINFFVDDLLSRTVTGTTAQSWDTIVIGPGTGTQAGTTWIDGVQVEIVPEPATLALAGIGLIGVCSVARRKNA
ncbi:MAG: hypothetical protein C0485_04640 [Pirellula sp.]|nr:hypothetical protein [Pirellula sp.]